MNERTLDAPAGMISDDTEDFAAEREQQVARFVKTSPGYYRDQFAKIGSDSKFVWTTNLWAGVLGPIWFSARGMWNWGLTFLILETLAIVQIVRGLFGDLSSEAWERIAKIKTIPTRSTFTSARFNRSKMQLAGSVWKPNNWTAPAS
jgi:hypothetical protein